MRKPVYVVDERTVSTRAEDAHPLHPDPIGHVEEEPAAPNGDAVIEMASIDGGVVQVRVPVPIWEG